MRPIAFLSGAKDSPVPLRYPIYSSPPEKPSAALRFNCAGRIGAAVLQTNPDASVFTVQGAKEACSPMRCLTPHGAAYPMACVPDTIALAYGTSLHVPVSFFPKLVLSPKIKVTISGSSIYYSAVPNGTYVLHWVKLSAVGGRADGYVGRAWPATWLHLRPGGWGSWILNDAWYGPVNSQLPDSGPYQVAGGLNETPPVVVAGSASPDYWFDHWDEN